MPPRKRPAGIETLARAQKKVILNSFLPQDDEETTNEVRM
jgi:hypothetical protein